jgi:hypothetical protein
MSGQGLLVLGLGSLQQPVSAGGAALWIDLSAFTVIVPVASNEIGACVLRLAIPPSAAIEGLTGYAQFLWKESGLPNGHLAASRGLAFTIQP